MAFGILQRYVIGELTRAFALSLTAITAVIVLFMVMAEAARAGLSPGQIVEIVPLLVPGTLPYTMPVALLFAVSVVYGRLAADNEITAIKASGLSVTVVLWPAFLLAAACSLLLYLTSNEIIPRANNQAKQAVFRNFEQMFHTMLKKERVFNNDRWPFDIMVKDVVDRTLIDPVFKHRRRVGGRMVVDFQVAATRASLSFDEVNGLLRVYLVDATLQPIDQPAPPRDVVPVPLPESIVTAEQVLAPLRERGEFQHPECGVRIKADSVSESGDRLRNPVFIIEDDPLSEEMVIVVAESAELVWDWERSRLVARLEESRVVERTKAPDMGLINNQFLEFPIPQRGDSGPPRTVQEMTMGEILAKQAECRDLYENERKRQVYAGMLWLAAGRLDRVNWPDIADAMVGQAEWKHYIDKLETEKQLRVALACGPFFFVLLGAPVGILFAKRDYMSAFMVCFLPVIMLYYPLTLLGINLGKEAALDPMYALWMGNAVLSALAGLVLPSVLKH